ncbi:MAG: hypothetical protein Q4G68_11530 [Planctomycetia bacterium]|nr:hypothetical protein [Planctomycetia bacterium]
MSLIFRIPNKLAKLVGLKNLPALPASESPQFDWSVGLFEYGRKQYLLLLNTESLLAELIPVTPQIARDVDQALFSAVEKFYVGLEEQGISPFGHGEKNARDMRDKQELSGKRFFAKYIQPQHNHIVYAKTLSRSLTGVLNRIIYEIQVRMDYEMTVDKINKLLKESVYRSLRDSKNNQQATGSVSSQSESAEDSGGSDTASRQAPRTKDESKKFVSTSSSKKVQSSRKTAPQKKEAASDSDSLSDDELRQKTEFVMRQLRKMVNPSGKFRNPFGGMIETNFFSDGRSRGEVLPDDLLDEAEMTPDPREVKKLVKKALKLDPDSFRAYHILAINCATTEGEYLKYLLLGKEIGEEFYPEGCQNEFDGNLWYDLEARPYLRILSDLADYHYAKGNLDETHALFEKILRLSKDDNLGIRYAMIFLLIEQGRDLEAEKLYKQYIERSAQWLYTRVLLNYRKYGPTSPRPQQTLKKAIKENPHFIKLCRSTELFNAHSTADSYTLGSLEEARTILDQARGAIVATEGFRLWCVQQSSSTH